jgi:deoxyribonuclease V
MSSELHSWTVDAADAIELQERLRGRLILRWDGRPVRAVAGVDVHYEDDWARAAIVVFRFPDLDLLEQVTAEGETPFPYIPGLLAFREGPVVLAAWAALAHDPDVILFDGHGIAHPRGFGLASHLGLWLETPSIGVAKSRLVGEESEPGPGRGEVAALLDEADPRRIIGASLRTREGARSVIVSPGHRIDLEHSLEFVLGCCRGHRLPEPLRFAHRLAANFGPL